MLFLVYTEKVLERDVVTPKKKEVYVPEDDRLHRFINYYVIKELWLMHHRKSAQLYATFVNKTLYDSILRSEGKDIEEQIKGLSDTTGISKDFFSGKRFFVIDNINLSDWSSLASLRKDRKNNDKSTAQKNLELKIDAALEKTYRGEGKLDQSVVAILHYVKTLDKITNNSCRDRINEIVSFTNGFTKQELMKVDPAILQDYEKELCEHYQLIRAINILNKK